MPARSKIDAMPPEVRDWISQALIERGFSGYQELAALIREKTGTDISHASVHRFGERIRRTMETIRATAEAARVITQANPDEADEHTAAVIRLVQSALFEAMLKVREAEDADPAEQVKLLSQAAQAVAQVGRASITQKRWQDEVRQKLDALEAQDKTGKRLDAETLKRVREALYGG